MQSYRHSFELNELPPSLNVYLRLHYQERNRLFQKIKHSVWINVNGYLPLRPMEKYKIVCTRHTIRPLDPFDNLPASFKVVIDSLVDFKVIKDDKWGMGELITCRQVRVRHKKDQKITVEVEEVRCV